MAVKFIQYFDVLSGQVEEFRSFAAGSYIPGVNDTGLVRIVGSWCVACGEGPYFIFEGAAPSAKEINRLLELDDFTKLGRLLHFLITNYKTKILVPSGIVGGGIPAGKHFRFNHHFNVNYNRFDEFETFMGERYLPVMERLGVQIIGGWNEAVGPGPGYVTEGACSGIEKIMEAIGSEDYRGMLSDMFNLVTGFGSKILVPTGLVQ